MMSRNLILYSVLITLAIGARASAKQEVELLHKQAYELLDTDLGKALLLSKEAEIVAKDAGLEFEEANSLFIQAYIYRQFDELGKSFVINLKALEILRPLKDDTSLITYVKILLNTGEILKQHYAYVDAVKYYDEAIAIAKKHQFTDRLIRLYYSKAMSLRHNRDYDYALSEIKKALSAALKANNEYMYVLALNQKGLIEKDMGRSEDARKSYQTIIDYQFERLNSSEYIGQAWHNIAVTFKMEGLLGEAIVAYKNAEEYHAIGSGNSDRFTTWLDLSEVYFLRKEYNKAFEYSQKSLAIYEDVALLPDHYKVYDLLSKILYAQRKFEDSHAFSQEYMVENSHFLKAQTDILRVKDQYKMEVLTAGFFVELNASKRQNELELYLILCGAIGTLIIVIGRSQFFLKKKSIKVGLTQIEKDSSV